MRPATASRRRRDAETHRVIKGRRWRVSDPALDDHIRQHLVDELMDARRAVKAALQSPDADDEVVARARVHDAKVALGERGGRWWEPMSPSEETERVDAFIRAIGKRMDDVPDTASARRLLRFE